MTASQSGLARPGSAPVPSTSPPTSTSTTRSVPSSALAAASPSATLRVPVPGSISTVGSPRRAAMRASANRAPEAVRVSGPASNTPSWSARAPVISAVERGPGSGSIGRRSQVTPPSTAGTPRRSQSRALASAPTTSPPPPMPITSARRAARTRISSRRMAASGGEAEPVSSRLSDSLGERRRERAGFAHDRLDPGGGAIELLVGDHWCSLVRQLAVDLHPGLAALVLGTHPNGHWARDPVDPQDEHVERVARLPAQPLERVVRRPDVEGRERVHDPRVRRLVVIVDLGPRPDPHAVRLVDAAVLDQRPRGRLAVRPDTFLERAAQLGVVRLAPEVVALMVDGGIEEEAVVLDLEVPVLLPDPALAQGQELLTLGKRTNGYGPLFERDWHET